MEAQSQTFEDERKINGCEYIPCIGDCKKCILEILNSNNNNNDE